MPGPVAALLELTDGPAPGGGTLADASHLHLFGLVQDDPLPYDRTDGSVWLVPEEGFVRYTGRRLERIADGVEEFFTEWVVPATWSSRRRPPTNPTTGTGCCG
ncbi:hypothetical protein [Kitasatospora phosalacinea]|uniref:hypothetical protein n=1 Tax=Kitasatospora phosalacinea TaxID=2065 RepID=UPI00052412FC|nr:hypothetical protein [Kitasatospora phosalacinea]